MGALLLLLLLSLGCVSIKPAPRYTKSSGKEAVVRELTRRQHAGSDRLLKVVDGYMGVPYKWGGTTRQGMDCSAFTRAIFRETYGIELPRTSKQMYRVGVPVTNQERLRPGDLVFFANTNSGPGISHVGIYLGKGRFAHASYSQGGSITTLDNTYFKPRDAGARRVER